MISKLLDILNDLRPRQLIMLASATLVFTFVMAYLAFYFIGANNTNNMAPAPAVPVPVATKQVVVAKSDIAVHTVISENMLEIREVPENLLPDGALEAVHSAVGRPAGITIYAGDIITSHKLFSDTTRSGMADSIPADCRAVSVGVSNITGVAGFAKAGDHVDVMLVQKDDYTAKSRMLLQNVLLLSINKDSGERIPSVNEDGVSVPRIGVEDPTIATLALQPQEAMGLVSAAALGEIYLMLRPSRSASVNVNQEDFTMYSMVSSGNKTAAGLPKPVQAPATAPVQAASVPEYEVPDETGQASYSGYEIIQGDKIMQK